MTTPNIDIVLQSRNGAGSIKGRVTDGGGNGIPNVAVRAYDFAQGEVQYATTGSTGDYTISFVPPIEARVYFDASTSSYASRWYNSKDSFGAADPININSGTHITGIDAVLGAKTIQLLSPNGGEVWAVGSSQNITWTSSLGVGKVRIEVSTDTGASYTDIAAEAENTGTYPWTVPDTPSTSCLIRISAAGALIDVSDARFAIAAAGVPRRLAFVQQPTGTTVNGTINPPITVEILDVVGNRVLTATDAVALSLRNAGSANLNGTSSRAAVGGLATFGNLSIDTAGTGYLLRANSGSLTEVDSIPFNITAPVATKVQVETLPDGSGVIVPAQDVPVGTPLTVYAIARDASNGFVGNIAADTWALVNKSGIADSDLVPAGDLKSATFTGHTSGSAQIRALKAGLTSVDSGVLTVTAGPAAEIVLTGPSSAGAGFISGVFTISVTDALGNPVNVSQDTLFNRASNSTGNKFFSSDPAGTSYVGRVTIPAGQNSASFYYRDDLVGTQNVTVTWSEGGVNLGSAMLAVNVRPVVHQIVFESDRDAGIRQIFGMNADGTGVLALTSGPSANMHPCPSPGGGRIVFASERDGNREIYVMNASGSNPVRLTTNTALDELPVWSPDEIKIAFERNYDIWVMDADGTDEINLTNDPGWDSFPSWSPDGTKIFFSSLRTGTNQGFVMNADGTGVTQVTHDPMVCMWGSWSPDGTKIAFSGSQGSNLDVYTIKPDGTGQIQLTAGAGSNYNPRWSPDGSWITFMSSRDGNAEIYVMNSDGAVPTRLTNSAADDAKPVWCGSRIWYSDMPAHPDGKIFSIFPDGTGVTRPADSSSIDSIPALSPDGTKIVFVRALPDSAIYCMRSDGTDASLLTNSSGRLDIDPCWSPDGTKIAFVSDRGYAGIREIYVMNADGSGVTRLTTGTLDYQTQEPAWSPDGTKIVYSVGTSARQVYVMNSDGSGQMALAMGESPSWSPNGQKIAYSNGIYQSEGIYIMNANGSNQVRLTATNGDTEPCWSPDGRKIAFVRTVSSLGQVHVMNADGTGVVQLTTNNTGAGLYPCWGAQARIFQTYAFVAKWGTQGAADGQFNYPMGIAVDSSGNVYVVDRYNDRIQKFDSSGTFLAKLGGSGSGDGQFLDPFDVAVDSSGFVYATDISPDRVQKFNSDRTFLTKWGTLGTEDGQFDNPWGIAVDISGYVYVADTQNNRIQKFTSDGTFLTKWGTLGTGDGQFYHPAGIAVDSSGHVYVSDQSNQRIQKFTSDGTFVTKWGSGGNGDGQFYNPWGIAVDSSGYVFVVDELHHRIQKFTSDGTFVTKWGTLGTEDGQFNTPAGIAVDGSGNVYVADWQNYRIQKFRKK